MSGRKRSKVWAFFRDTGDKSKVKCVVCGVTISRGGVGRKASSSALTNHLKLKHADKFKQLTGNVRQADDNSISAPHPSTSTTQPTISVPQQVLPSITSSQVTIEESLITKWKINDPRSVPIHNAITEMIALDNQPISIVEDKGFSRLMNLIKPKYQIPSRNFFGETCIPQLYQKLRDNVQSELCKSHGISVTSDMWTCMNNLYSFLSFTAHWLDDDYSVQHRVLQIKSFFGQHTADNIRMEFEEITSIWQITAKIHIIMTDSGANIVKAVKDSPFAGERCFLHILQRVVLEALQCQSTVGEAIALGRKIVSHFNHSPQAQEKLIKIQEELNLPQHKLIQDIVTRWNSKYYMCQRLVEQKRAISLYISDNNSTINVQNLQERQWQLVQECLLLLQPFEEITKKVSSTYSCISEVIPHTKILLRYLMKEEVLRTCNNIELVRAALKEELERRTAKFEDDKYYTIATMLDPRFKMNFFTPNNVPVIRRHFLLEHVRRSADMESSSSSDNESEQRASSSKLLHETHIALWNCYEELASAKQPETVEPKSPIVMELDRYISENLVSRDICPYSWWSKNKIRFPLMDCMAKIYLSAPGSSVYSERLFSEAGNVYEKKRSKLLPDKAEHLIFLHHNLPLVNFKY